jgi:hypothetical protein
MSYEKELDTYHLKLPELLAHEGEFAVIRGVTVLGSYDTYKDALKAGYRFHQEGQLHSKKVAPWGIHDNRYDKREQRNPKTIKMSLKEITKKNGLLKGLFGLAKRTDCSIESTSFEKILVSFGHFLIFPPPTNSISFT